MQQSEVNQPAGRTIADQLSGERVSGNQLVRQFERMSQLERMIRWSSSEVESGSYRLGLYRFLTDAVPIISAAVWTWVRMTAASGSFVAIGENERANADGRRRLDRLTRRLFRDISGNQVGLSAMLPELLLSLYRDGLFGGFLTIHPDASGVDCFSPVDPLRLRLSNEQPGGYRVYLETDQGKLKLNRPDFYLVPFNGSGSHPFGRSILQAVPFVAYIEQQLVEDMRRSSHNAGYHRLHVRITPPERMAGESDSAYTDRINSYFDATVRMIRGQEVDDNPVTWNNVEIAHVGPTRSSSVTNSWFMGHRAMIEDICAGTNLAPFLLGYSYGATTTWADFKFDVVMRQVRSVQEQVARFLEWIGAIDLALAGIPAQCQWEFDNSFAYQAKDQAVVETARVDNIIKLLQAGLIDREDARRIAERIV